MGIFFSVFGRHSVSSRSRRFIAAVRPRVVCSPKIYIKMSFATTIYNTVCKRTSTFAVAIIGGTFLFERTFDIATTNIFDSINRGKQWKDIKHKYEKNE